MPKACSSDLRTGVVAAMQGGATSRAVAARRVQKCHDRGRCRRRWPGTAFARMLERGIPPDDWASLMQASRQNSDVAK